MADTPLTKLDEIIAKASDKFVGNLPDIENAIAEEVTKIIKTLTIKGGQIIAKDELSKKLVARLEQQIIDKVSKTGYYSNISELLTNFDEVEKNALNLQKEYSDLIVKPEDIGANSLKQWAVDNAIYSLKEGGFKYNVIQPIKESLTRAVILGGSLTDLEAEIKTKTNGALGNYAGGVVRDVFSQYEGVVQKKIEVVYDLNAYLYVGGLKKTSRPQCKRWVKMGVLLKKNLAEEIAWANRNGTGMIAETTPETFPIYRGGWGCLHKAIPTRR